MAALDILADRYTHALHNELGYSPIERHDNQLIFTAPNGATCILTLDADDPAYLHISTGWRVPENFAADEHRMLTTCTQITRKIKAAKAVPADDSVLLSVEILAAPAKRLPNTDTICAYLPRVMSMLAAAADKLYETVKFHDLTRQIDIDTDELTNE